MEIRSGERSGEIKIHSSKSQLHRLLICAALAEGSVTLRHCGGISRDIAATMACLAALGAACEEEPQGILRLRPIARPFAPNEQRQARSLARPFAPNGQQQARSLARPLPSKPEFAGCAAMPCGESGSTLRFMLPIAGALGARVVFQMEGRLPERPLAPFDEELRRGGMSILAEGSLLYAEGRLKAGEYTLPGNVSSQYVSGLLMALPLLDGDSTLKITGKIESEPYIAMTEDALAASQIDFEKNGSTYRIKGAQTFRPPAEQTAEGDYSNAAFFMAMGALSEKGVTVRGLNPESKQGDKVITELLRGFGAEVRERGDAVFVRKSGRLHGQIIDASQAPDLVPVLAVTAAVCEGETRIVNAERLRLKESDRLASAAGLINSLGGYARVTEDGLTVKGRECFAGGVVEAHNDHRIAMSAAVAACASDGRVVLSGGECVQKSFPDFWQVFDKLDKS